MPKKKAKKDKKFIQKAVKRPGRLTEICKRRGYSGATCKCAREVKADAQRRGDKSLMSAAVLGMRFMGCKGVKGKIGKKKKKRASKRK